MTKSGKPEQIAIIDIGSNSVRLVVMKRDKNSLKTILNDKKICELGDRDSEGNIKKKNKNKALDALKEFQKYIDKHKIEQVVPVATAAARHAGNGTEFIKKAEKKLGHSIWILSDQEEAEMAANGVLAAYEIDGLSTQGVRGFAADLGGGSLELAFIDQDKVVDGISLELGTLILREHDDPSTLAQDTINHSRFGGHKVPNLFVIGGSWRAVKKTWKWSHQDLAGTSGAPLETEHMTSIPANAAIEHLDHIISLEGADPSKRKGQKFPKDLDDKARALFEEFPKIKPERANKIFDASKLLKVLIEATETKNVIFVECGLREAIAHAHFSRSPLRKKTGQLFCKLHSDNNEAGSMSHNVSEPEKPSESCDLKTGAPRSFSQKS